MATSPIAIIGGVGCGKTVLLSVLAHKYAITQDGYSLVPKNREAFNFVHKNWSLLESGQWPPPTPPAQKNQLLDWDLHYGKDCRAQILTTDIAGEKWVDFIDNNCDRGQITSSGEEQLKKLLDVAKRKMRKEQPQDLCEINNLIKNASCVLVLLNLADIIDKKPGEELQAWVPLAICHYLETLGKADTMALVLTQTDKYNYCLKDCDNDWYEVLNKYIPEVYSVISQNEITILPVAAVDCTRLDEKREPKPASNFGNIGIKDLLDWVSQKISIKDNKEKNVNRLSIVIILLIPIVIYIIWALLFIRIGSIAAIIGLLLFCGYLYGIYYKFFNIKK